MTEAKHSLRIHVIDPTAWVQDNTWSAEYRSAKAGEWILSEHPHEWVQTVEDSKGAVIVRERLI